MWFEDRNLALMQPLQNMPYSPSACFHSIIRRTCLKASPLRYLPQNSTRTATTSQNYSSYNYWLSLIDHFLKSCENCLLLIISASRVSQSRVRWVEEAILLHCQNQLQAASQNLWFHLLKMYGLLGVQSLRRVIFVFQHDETVLVH